MEYRGHAPDGFDEVVFRGDVDGGEFLAFRLNGSIVQAAMDFGVWDVGDELEALLRARRPVDARSLADASVPLGRLAPAPAAH